MMQVQAILEAMPSGMMKPEDDISEIGNTEFKCASLSLSLSIYLSIYLSISISNQVTPSSPTSSQAPGGRSPRRRQRAPGSGSGSRSRRQSRSLGPARGEGGRGGAC